MNRILTAIHKMKEQIEDRIERGLTTKERLKETCEGLDMDIEEHCKFQERKSIAVAEGKLTVDEGQTVYQLLGNTPTVFNKQPVHVKYVLTSLLRELLEK